MKSLETSLRKFLARNWPELIEVVSGNIRQSLNGAIVDTPMPDFYEIRPRENDDGFDLISDQLRDGPIWYAGPDATRNAAAYANYHSWLHSRRAIIRVSDSATL